MTTNFVQLDSIIKRYEYLKLDNSSKNKAFYWKKDKDKEFMVILVDAIKELVFFEKDIEDLRETCFSSVPADNIYIILLGNKNTLKLKCNNVICIDADLNRMKKKGCDVLSFSDEIEKLLTVNRMTTKVRNSEVQSSYETGAFGVYALALLITYCFLKYNKRHIEFAVNKASIIDAKNYLLLIRYMFMHKSIRHLISNLAAMLVLGRNYVNNNGNVKFLITFIAGGIGAGLVSIYGNNPEVYTVGCSGALFAVMGALFMDVIINRREQWLQMLFYCIVTFVLSSFGNVDIYCHAGGFLCGMLVQVFLNNELSLFRNIKQLYFLKTYRKKRNEYARTRSRIC